MILQDTERHFLPPSNGRFALLPLSPAYGKILSEKGGDKCGVDYSGYKPFFLVFEDRAAEVLNALSTDQRNELEEEMKLLKISILNRIAEVQQE